MNVSETKILETVKQIVGIVPDDTSFDLDIKTHINSIMTNLLQIGVGNPNAIPITENTLWNDFVDKNNLASIKTYISSKVRLIFDPPTSSIVYNSINEQCKEIEWRLSIENQGGNN